MIAFPKPKRVSNPKVLEIVRNQVCVICHTYGCDPDHITTKGAGGGDTGDNVWPLCRIHHTEKGTIGITTFVKKYVKAQKWLRDAERWDILAPITNEELAENPRKKKQMDRSREEEAL